MKPKTMRPIKTNSYDVCQTPPHALEPLYPILDNWKKYLIQSGLVDNLRIWESACGPEKLMVKEFLKRGYEVQYSDILYGPEGNYFDFEPAFDYDIEITNVPFSLKYKWIHRACKRGKPFIFIVPYETTASKEFMQIKQEYGKDYFAVLAPERRINYKMPYKGWGKMEWDDKSGKEVLRGAQAQMPTCFLCWQVLDLEFYYGDALRTFYVPMRNVKYNDDNSVKE